MEVDLQYPIFEIFYYTKGDFVEKFLYEYRPHICLTVAAYAYYFVPHSQIQMTCAATLAACAVYVYFMRNRERVRGLFRSRR